MMLSKEQFQFWVQFVAQELSNDEFLCYKYLYM